MQRVTMVRYVAKAECAAENERLARAVFDELRATAPDNLAYGLFSDGAFFVHLFVNKTADDASQLVELPSFKAYAEGIAARCETPPDQTRLSVRLLDAYGFDTQPPA